MTPTDSSGSEQGKGNAEQARDSPPQIKQYNYQPTIRTSPPHTSTLCISGGQQDFPLAKKIKIFLFIP